MSHDTHTVLVHVGDAAAAVVACATLAGLLPQIAAMFTIIWTGMRIYEMVTGHPFSESTIAKWTTGRD